MISICDERVRIEFSFDGSTTRISRARNGRRNNFPFAKRQGGIILLLNEWMETAQRYLTSRLTWNHKKLFNEIDGQWKLLLHYRVNGHSWWRNVGWARKKCPSRRPAEIAGVCPVAIPDWGYRWPRRIGWNKRAVDLRHECPVRESIANSTGPINGNRQKSRPLEAVSKRANPARGKGYLLIPNWGPTWAVSDWLLILSENSESDRTRPLLNVCHHAQSTSAGWNRQFLLMPDK